MRSLDLRRRGAPSRRVVAAVLACALAALLPVAPASGHGAECAPARPNLGEWPMFGRDVASSRSQPAEHVLTALNAPTLAPVWTFDANRWTLDEGNEITGYPVVVDGCVFVGSSTGNDEQGGHREGWVFALNADTGQVVWQTRVAGGIYSTVAFSAGVVYAFVSRVSSPFVVALDARTGEVLWQRTVDVQFGSDAVSSPIVFDGMVWVGVSGTAAEGSEADRNAFQGSSVLIAAERLVAPSFVPADADRAVGTRIYEAGEVVRKIWTIPPALWPEGYAGGAQWGTIAIDAETGYGYVGTGNPFNYDSEHAHTNAVLKLDLDRGRETFGQIVGSYKGEIESYVDEAAGVVPCEDVEQVGGVFAGGFECARLDLDFGATPNILRDETGRKVVVVGQKSGVVHVFDADTLEPLTKTRLGVPSPVGGMVGSAATDGVRVYGSHTVGGYLYAIDTAGDPQWITPVADGVHWGPPVTHANHVLYTVDLKGFLDAYDVATGAPLLHRPMQLGADPATLTRPPLSWGAATVARNTVYASVGVGLTSAGMPSVPNGFVIAYRPMDVPPRAQR